MNKWERKIRTDCRTLAASERTMESVYNLIFAHGDRVMTVDASLVGASSRKTYRQAKAEIEAVARRIVTVLQGKTGGYVGLYGENKPAWMILFWAVLKSGNLPYLINLRQPAEFAAEALSSLGAKLTVCVSSAPECLGTEILSYGELLKNAPESAPEVPFGDGFALSTSGTTLSKKVCVYSGKNVVSQILNTEGVINLNPAMVKGYKGQIRHLMFLPLYHIFGLEAVFLWFSFFGSAFIFPPDLNPQNLLRTVRDHNVTHIFAVPLLWGTVEKKIRNEAASSPELQKKLEKGLRLSRTLQAISPWLGKKIAANLFRSVRERLFGDCINFCISGGSAIKSSTLELINGMGYHLCNGYGMSEIGIPSVDLSRRMKDRVLGTIGKPFSSVAYRIDCDGKLLVKGDSLCGRMIVDGLDCPMGEWFNTGDLMTRDDQGRYRIGGRASDLVFGEDGENLNPEFAEQVFELPQCKNFTVTGDEQNEKLMLIVQIDTKMDEGSKEGLLSAIAAGNDALPSAYKIKEIRFTYDPILGPKDIKVSRARLRRQIKDGTVRLTDSIAAPPPQDSSETTPLKTELRQMFAEILGLPAEKITDHGHFMNDLGGSSLDYFTLIGKIDEVYGITLEFEMENFSYCLADFERIIRERLS